jgi:hypothetical protein
LAEKDDEMMSGRGKECGEMAQGEEPRFIYVFYVFSMS